MLTKHIFEFRENEYYSAMVSEAEVECERPIWEKRAHAQAINYCLKLKNKNKNWEQARGFRDIYDRKKWNPPILV